ncbi:hypothetical protein C8R44DRAFT_872279 [Mycena epipterygia]|nr:hypothetical protein C8R44DRAFT_872279 [Mycena epipterygia]
MRAKFAQIAGIAALAPSHLPTTLLRSDLPQHLTVPIRAPPLLPWARPRIPCTHSRSRRRARTSALRTRSSPCTPSSSARTAPPSRASRTLPSRPAPTNSHSSMSLPVLSLALPSPQAFTILHDLMYTHRLASALFLLPPAFLASLKCPSTSHANSHSHSQDAAHTAILAALTSGTTRHTFATHLHATSGGSLTVPMGHAGYVKEL